MAPRGECEASVASAQIDRSDDLKAKTLRESGSTAAEGLTTAEALQRLQRFGPNALYSPPAPTVFARFLSQFSDVTVLALLAAAAVAVGIGSTRDASEPMLSRFGDATAIAIIVLLNAVIGLLQERRAESALAALKELAGPKTRVRRDGVERTVPSQQLVVGDVVLLREGDKIPADLRLVEAVELRVNEASLTGESEPVTKSADVEVPPDAPLAERANMAFSGTHVDSGHGEGTVIATGMTTELGRIAAMLATVESPETPLQLQLRRFGARLVVACVVVAIVVFVVGILRTQESAAVLFMTAVSLAVAAIPEGLPAVTTIVLALGVERMAKRNALVRRLSSVETLGAVDVICTDKTGTLTQNLMTVRRLSTAFETLRVVWNNAGSAKLVGANDEETDGSSDAAVAELVFACSLPRSARIVQPRATERRVIGSSSEGALLVFAAARGEPHVPIKIDHEVPFARKRGMATVAIRRGADVLKYHHGIPEHLIERATHVFGRGGDSVVMTAETRAHLLGLVEKWGREGLRILAIAKGDVAAMTFIGLVALNDPPRPEVSVAAKKAARAGIRTVIITGDHPSTAESIAREIGLAPRHVIVGSAMDALDSAALAKLVEQVDIVARATPAQKLRFVQALSARGHVVAMTGDGVNDAPALRAAAIGIAMGKSGTDVAREAADIVLSDDNYATLVTAVDEGRIIFSNITKFIFFLLSINAGLVAAIFVAALLGWPSLLTPTQILWINLVTNGLPALALGMERVHLDHMSRKPRKPSTGFITGRAAGWIVVYGALMAASGLAVFAAYRTHIDEARSMAFTVLALAPVLYAFSCRSRNRSILELGVFSNPKLVGAACVALVLQGLALYVPALSSMFRTTPLSAHDLVIALLIAVGVLASAETPKIVRKWVHASRESSKKAAAARR